MMLATSDDQETAREMALRDFETEIVVRNEGPDIFWRGTSRVWTFMLLDRAKRLRDLFMADRESYAQDYARQLSAAIEQAELYAKNEGFDS